MNVAVLLTTLLFASAVLMLWAACTSALRRDAAGLRGLAAVLAISSLWCVLDGLWLVAPTGDVLWLIKRLQFIPYTLLPVARLYLLLDYRAESWRRTRVWLLTTLIVPVLTNILVWTNHWHHLIFVSFVPYMHNGVRMLDAERGPWFLLHLGYATMLMFATTLLLAYYAITTSRQSLWRIVFLIAGLMTPGLSALFTVFNFGLSGFNWTAPALAASGFMMTLAFGRLRVFDVVPMAHDLILRQMPEPVVVIEPDGRVLMANPAAVELLGLASSSPSRRLTTKVLLERTMEPVTLHEIDAPGDSIVFDLPSGRRWFHVSVTPLHFGSHLRLGRILVLRESTEDRELRRSLEESHRAANAANRAKSEFLAVMSHELRTPLNAVIGSAGLLMETQLDAAQVEYAGMIRNSGQSLLRIINDILDLSKIEAGRMTLERIDFSLRSAVEDCVEVVMPAALRKGLEVIVEFDRECSGMFHGDPARLRQILINFLSNASKFTEHGSIKVEARCVGQTPPERSQHLVDVVLSVTDTGIGIEPEAQAQIFESFRQGESSTTRRFGGTGLGLAICRKLAEMMDGEVGCTSVPGQGSRFWCRLRLATAEPRTMLPPPPAPALVARESDMRDRLVATLEECGISAAEVLRTPELDLEHASRQRSWLIEWAHPAFEAFGGASMWCERVLRLNPEVRIAVLGRINDSVREAARVAGVAAFLDEPWLVRRVRSFLIPQAPLAVPGLAKSTATSVESPRILLVEDNEINRRIATLMLAELNPKLDVAVNGREAVQRALHGDYDLILMDLQMPEMGGIEATHEIRTAELDSGRRRVPICALTAGVLNNERDRCLEAGMDDFLSKPIMKAQLIEVCRRWIGANDAEI